MIDPLLPKQRVAGSSPVSRSTPPHEDETRPSPGPPRCGRSSTSCFRSRRRGRRYAATSPPRTRPFSPAARLRAAG